MSSPSDFDHFTPKQIPLYCPISPAYHPGESAAQTQAIEWMDRRRLFDNTGIDRERVLATGSARAAGSMIPAAPEELLLLHASYLYLGFSIDDLFDRGPLGQRRRSYRKISPKLAHLLESPLAEHDEEDPLLSSFATLRQQIAMNSTGTQIRLWSSAFEAWLLGVAWELDFTHRSSDFSLDDYLIQRLYSGAARAAIVSVEICGGGGELPAEEREMPSVAAMGQAAGLLINLHADLFSYAGEKSHNIVNVLTRSEGGLQPGINRSIELCNRIMGLFVRLHEQTAADVSPPTQKYLKNLGHMISGNLQWCYESARYRRSPARAPLLCRDRVGDEFLAASPCPSIAWWWEVGRRD
ncbi:hypothetical protein AB0D08_18860 [Kitasatospora sp. NPDC048540]|uniref:terpene synthase family protein n=1 Tax=unclassified Kitasatospora TaxID=2633591 RepID=UPI0011EA6255|nr:hypothetical protein [Kitasatospora sp. MBT63]